MLTLSAKVRKTLGRKTKSLRVKGILPAVVYGPQKKSIPLELDYKSFEEIYRQAGESSLILLDIDSPGIKNKLQVLIHDVKLNPLSGKFIHVDLYQAPLTVGVEAKVPIVFEGEAPAVKELGGTLVKNISDLEVKALPQNLPKEIRINISLLKNFEDHILIKDLKLPLGVKILKDSGEIIVRIAPPEKIEVELEKPIEEKIEEVEKVEPEKVKENEEER